MRHLFAKALRAGLAVGTGLTPVIAGATVQNLISTPQETSGPFLHNVFHTAGSNGGQSGGILAWFDLGTGGGTWNDVTGAFSMDIDLFSNSGLTGSLGSATGTGNLAASAFNGHDGGLIGTISWDFDATAEGNGFTDITLSFIDINYVTSSAGYTANSTTANSMTLWGADGTYNAGTGVFDTDSTSLGMDLVVLFAPATPPVPLPPSILLLGSGLVAVAGISRRKR